MKKLLSFPFAIFFFACSAANTGPLQGDAPAAGDDSGAATADDGGASATEDAAPVCVAPAKSACGQDGSWVKGVVHYDPAHFKAGATPMLRVALRHGFTVFAGEEKIGGRLHAYTNVKVDPTKGEAAYAIDMCDGGVAMWSEENGAFNLVFIMDENGNNDLDNATSNTDAIVIGTPDATELQKKTDVTVSCHTGAQCLEPVTLDCTGTSCLTITPMTSCKKTTPSCKSDESYCM